MVLRREQPSPANELKAVAGRTPPNDTDTEAVVLSELLANADSFDRVAAILEPDMFWSMANKRIYAIVKEMQERGETPDTTAIARIAKERQWLDQMGGTPYLVQIATAYPAPGNLLEQHARSLRDLYRRRLAIAQGQRLVAEGYGEIEDDQEWLEGIEKSFSDIAHDSVSSEVEPVGVIAARQMQRLYEARAQGIDVSGVPTGFKKLDFLMSGLHPGDLYIIAGRPGMGKTVLLTTILRNIARYDRNHEEDTLASLMFSLEQPKEQIAMRVLCAEGSASYARVRANHFHNDDYARLNDALGALVNVPLYVDDTSAITLLEIRAKITKLQKQLRSGLAAIKARALGAIGIDYIQLMRAERELRARGSREQEVSSFTQGLKNLAKDLGVPVLALSQLNRGVEQRTDKRPQLNDLRESGAIEQDADAILFLYREGYYKKDGSRDTEVIIAKQRNGPTETVHVAFEAEHMVFRNLTEHESSKLSSEGSGIRDDEVNEDGSF